MRQYKRESLGVINRTFLLLGVKRIQTLPIAHVTEVTMEILTPIYRQSDAKLCNSYDITPCDLSYTFQKGNVPSLQRGKAAGTGEDEVSSGLRHDTLTKVAASSLEMTSKKFSTFPPRTSL